jgi:hypothetical protein
VRCILGVTSETHIHGKSSGLRGKTESRDT